MATTPALGDEEATSTAYRELGDSDDDDDNYLAKREIKGEDEAMAVATAAKQQCYLIRGVLRGDT